MQHFSEGYPYFGIYLGIMSGIVLSVISELLQLQYLATFCIHLLSGFSHSPLVERGWAAYDPSGICNAGNIPRLALLLLADATFLTETQSRLLLDRLAFLFLFCFSRSYETSEAARNTAKLSFSRERH
jgi:hypothetical protein